MPDPGMSMEDLLNEAAGGTNEPNESDEQEDEQNDDQADSQVNEQEDDEQEDDGQEDGEQEDDEQEDDGQEDGEQEDRTVRTKTKDKKKTKKNPMKEVRDRYNTEKQTREKIEKVLNKYTEGDYEFKIKDFAENGKIDYDAFAEAMETADNKQKAESRGVTPEVQAEIDRIEKEKLELQKARLQVSMDKALTNMQIELKLDQNAINNFFKDAMAVKKNPYQWLGQGGNLKDLYYVVYRDKTLKKERDLAIEEARVKWEEETGRRKKTPTSNPGRKRGGDDSNNPDGLSMADLLAEATKKTR